MIEKEIQNIQDLAVEFPNIRTREGMEAACRIVEHGINSGWIKPPAERKTQNRVDIQASADGISRQMHNL